MTHFILFLIVVSGNFAANLSRSRYSEIAAFLETAMKYTRGPSDLGLCGRGCILVPIYTHKQIIIISYTHGLQVTQVYSSFSAFDSDSLLR